MSGVGIKSAKEGESGVVALPIVGIANEQVDHGAPVLLCGPVRIILGDGCRGHDGVPRMKTVVVNLAVGPETRRIAGEHVPGLVVYILLLASGCEPDLQAGFQFIEHLVALGCGANLVGNMHGATHSAHFLATVVGIHRTKRTSRHLPDPLQHLCSVVIAKVGHAG